MHRIDDREGAVLAVAGAVADVRFRLAFAARAWDHLPVNHQAQLGGHGMDKKAKTPKKPKQPKKDKAK